jgi:hypothetical protein
MKVDAETNAVARVGEHTRLDAHVAVGDRRWRTRPADRTITPFCHWRNCGVGLN